VSLCLGVKNLCGTLIAKSHGLWVRQRKVQHEDTKTPSERSNAPKMAASLYEAFSRFALVEAGVAKVRLLAAKCWLFMRLPSSC
jgi:hypothetical protein